MESLHVLIRKTGVMHSDCHEEGREGIQHLNFGIHQGFQLGPRTLLDAHTQTLFVALTPSQFAAMVQSGRSCCLLPYCLTLFLGRDAPADSSRGCEVLPPSPCLGLAPGTTEMSGLAKLVPGEGGLPRGRTPPIPAFRPKHDLMCPLLPCCLVRCSSTVPAFPHPCACRCNQTCKRRRRNLPWLPLPSFSGLGTARRSWWDLICLAKSCMSVSSLLNCRGKSGLNYGLCCTINPLAL